MLPQRPLAAHTEQALRATPIVLIVAAVLICLYKVGLPWIYPAVGAWLCTPMLLYTAERWMMVLEFGIFVPDDGGDDGDADDDDDDDPDGPVDWDNFERSFWAHVNRRPSRA